MEEHLLLQLGDTVKYKGETYTVSAPFMAHTPFPPYERIAVDLYPTTARRMPLNIFLFRSLTQEEVDRQCKKLVKIDEVA